MPTDDREELRRLAEAATAGPWNLGRARNGHTYDGEWWPQVWPGGFGAPIADLNGRPGAKDKDAADAAFIAAANPAAVLALLDEIAELRASFDLRWKADMRAIKRWQAAHPGKENIWPDHADLVVWLLDLVEGAER